MATQATENYLKAIYKLEQRCSNVSPSDLAHALHISPASVSNMLKKLDDVGFVRHEPYRSVTLTDRGRMKALSVIRNHRVLEMYLSKILGLSWDEVDQEAEVLEHLVSETLIEAMDQALDHPRFDPHGSPIPDAHGKIPAEPPAFALSDLELEAPAKVWRIQDAADDVLRYLSKLDITPGARIAILERAPFGGPLMLAVNERECAIGPDLAAKIWVTLL